MKMPTGKMMLVFRKREDGRTYLARQYFKLPLQIMPPHYQDEDGTAFVYLLNPSGGVLQHDRLFSEIILEKNSRALITTPASTKLYKMEDGHAEIVNRFQVGEGSALEYLPEHNVPFAQSKTLLENIFYLDKDGILIASDMVTAGRVSRGEIFDYDLYASKTKIYVDGRLMVYDNSRIEPKTMDLREAGMLEGYLVNGTVYVYAPALAKNLAEELNTCIHGGNVRFAAGNITERLLVARFLGRSMIDLENTMMNVWGKIRESVLGKPAVRIRKF
ncbi:urease accessory protein UreD [Anaerovorax odorimutans]|uniref:Urease accessory protein UreD n=1 Tax=Anaerovorax odorimutans TaxID=109327 RepID=A0ABT1RJ23_9FIRM|nr:urease accessory protein UreD [Anaerovorax odorimutans]MCQ4635183.1 urease accessory protein UreD [Anaerovorax odorimutans]